MLSLTHTSLSHTAASHTKAPLWWLILIIVCVTLQSLPAKLVVADMGCGDAKIAQNVPQKVHSFDLVAANKWITACDIAKALITLPSCHLLSYSLSFLEPTVTMPRLMANPHHHSLSSLSLSLSLVQVPLADKSVDIVIFCLSLMGTNLYDFLIEAHRILVPK